MLLGPVSVMSPPAVPKKSWLAHYTGLVGAWAKGNANAHDAEDAVQDAAERLLATDTLVIRDARAYLHRSAVNGLISRHRRAESFPAVPLQELAEADHPVVDDVESAAYVDQMSQALSESLSELPRVCQQIFAWHRLENWTVPEIANHMGLSVSTVEKNLTKAMRHLHEKLRRFAS